MVLFEGIHSHTMHFSDRDVLLYNTLDYPSYALAVEKLKSAFRSAYSLLDKVAFFLNDYASVPVANVSFRSVWYIGQMQKEGRPTQLVQLQNFRYADFIGSPRISLTPIFKMRWSQKPKPFMSSGISLEHRR